MSKRRGNGEGSITKRSDGRYMARYYVETPSGRKRRTIYGPTREAVSDALIEALAQRNGGALTFDAEELTVGEYLDRWLSDSVRGSVKETTRESYERQIRNHIRPVIGHVRLAKLGPAHLQRFYRNRLDAGLAPGTVRQSHAIIHRALKQAQRWRLIGDNPADAVDPPKPRPDEIRPLDADQAKVLLDAAHDDPLEALYVLAITTGMRIGELLGLKWSDLDPDAAKLRVARTLSRAQSGPRFTTPKNGHGRTIHLTPRAVAVLRKHRAAQNVERLRAGSAWQDEGLVFTGQTGSFVRIETLHAHSFKPLLKRAGLPDIRFHDLRHTAATLLLSRGVHIRFVQELLGHSSAGITLDTYSHFLPSMGDQVAVAMEDALS